MGDIHELFVLALSLVWFAGATPENGCTNFMGAWKENLHAHKIPRCRGDLLGFLGGGGGSADFIFMGAGIYLMLGSEQKV